MMLKSSQSLEVDLNNMVAYPEGQSLFCFFLIGVIYNPTSKQITFNQVIIKQTKPANIAGFVCFINISQYSAHYITLSKGLPLLTDNLLLTIL